MPSPTPHLPTSRIAELKWKPDWPAARLHHQQWWQGRGFVLWLTAPKDQPWENLPKPTLPSDPRQRWYDPRYRLAKGEYELSRTYFGADAMPMLQTWAGAGDLAAYLGCPVQCSPSTVWFDSIMPDPPEDFPPLKLDPLNPVLRDATALIEQAVAHSNGRYLVSQPDIIENIDILASLRGTQSLLMDMIERPQWIETKLGEINDAFYQAFDLFYDKIADAFAGNTFAFNLWGPGKTAKVQCDACAMFGPAMFRRFVAPPLRAQCDWLDYAMYHLDGEEALPNLDTLLEIDTLQAIEWTPKRVYADQCGGKPMWYDLYRRILRAGKSVQAICVQPDDVLPLLDAVGPNGLHINCHCTTEQQAHTLEEKIAPYRPRPPK